jgi:hypothetical protein
MKIFYRLRKPIICLLLTFGLIFQGYTTVAGINDLNKKESEYQSDSTKSNSKSSTEIIDDSENKESSKEVNSNESLINYNFILYLLYKYIKSNTTGGSH